MNYISLVRVCIILLLASPTLLANETRISVCANCQPCIRTKRTHLGCTADVSIILQQQMHQRHGAHPRSSMQWGRTILSIHRERHTDTQTQSIIRVHSRVHLQVHTHGWTRECISVRTRAAVRMNIIGMFGEQEISFNTTMSAAVQERLGLATRHRQLWDLWVR
jgi:hypothetical protein